VIHIHSLTGLGIVMSDFVIALIVVAFAALSWGLLELSDRLMGGQQ
jgi:hypothetical protein